MSIMKSLIIVCCELCRIRRWGSWNGGIAMVDGKYEVWRDFNKSKIIIEIYGEF
jgi:hypothetical protein